MTYGMSSSTGQIRPHSSTGFKEKRPHGYQKFSLQNFTPEMMDLFQQRIAELGPEGFLAQLASGRPEMFEQMEAPAHRQFQEQIGQLGSRFSGMGMGARQSSGFQNQATSAASNFAQQLQANRLALSRQAQMDLMQMSDALLKQRPFEQGYVKKEEKGGGYGGLIGAGIGGVGGFFAGGPAGAMTGASLGYNVGSAFDKGGGGQMPVNFPSNFGSQFSQPQQPSSAAMYDQLFRHTGVAPY